MTIPQRAYGYFTLLHFDRTPEQIINRLKEISMDALKEECELIDAQYQEYKKIDKSADKEKIVYYPEVYTFGELVDKLKAADADGFDTFYAGVYAGIKEDIEAELEGVTINAAKILELQAVSFDYIEEEMGTDCRGFIAEDVAEVLPNLVIPEEGKKPAGLDYITMIPYLQAVIKDQERRIAELEKKINEK